MRKHFFLFLCLCCSLTAIAAERVSLDQILREGWEAYIGKTITITTPLYVCGNYYDSLLLAPERLYAPEERAVGLSEGDSTAYWAIRRSNRAQMVRLSCKLSHYKVRTGAMVRNLTARVEGEAYLVTGQTPRFRHNRPEPLPKTPKADLILCASNIQNYFYDLGGYATRRTTREQFAMQTLKIAKGLHHIRADLYALCEIQKGDRAPRALVEAMNRQAGKELYSFVDPGWSNGDTISCGFIYRVDKVRPYGEVQHAYHDPSSHYHYRLLALGFEDLATGERIILNVNHLRSKRGTGYESNQRRMANTDSLLVMLRHIQEEAIFGDEDLLLVGDFNCYTQEEPLQTLVQNGFADMLMRYDSTGYSYVYRSEVGYLDRVFANPSMAAQVVYAHPYHLNADYYYSRGYKRGLDDTIFRFSDHDPLVIGIRWQR